MAKVLGESGRYVSQEAARKRAHMVIVAFLIVGLLCVVEGLVLSSFIPLARFPAMGRGMVSLAVLVGILVVFKWGTRKFNTLEKQRIAMTRGATGEIIVGSKLADFPNDFCVINDLTTPFGNLDHVVVGPTGVFVLDSKNWRGIVSADGKGELLLNDQPTGKPFVRQFIGRVMGIREKVRALAPGLDPFYQGVFVFTAAWVQAKWGTTGSVNCITDDQLRAYIVEKDFGKKLKPAEVQLIAQAFLGLAHMDREFGSDKNAPKQTG